MKIWMIILAAFMLMPALASAYPAEEKPDSVVTVYYFHGGRRCQSCIKIEKYTEEAVNNYFQEQLESGDLVYRVINTDKKENRHYIDDYQLYTKSVILSLARDGKEVRHKNLNKVWQYLRDRDKFIDYFREETEEFLAGLEKEKGKS
ncbi:MAG: hypothetical protein GF417_01820 [Candidatus Latescibacteria bacterium]|nr:hypothetical protein [bacterium]MBD3423165.1 hypothetical protein [Candidatus Latescibacterota bacterium]